jgi:hypothetical protein
MIFSEPCCRVLKSCLEDGDERAFHRAADSIGPLVVRVKSQLYRTHTGQDRQWVEIPVYFCPFCGTRLQTGEAVERYYMSGDTQ